jgi:Tfp pilus assembly protein PilX
MKIKYLAISNGARRFVFRRDCSRRGLASVLAMLFLILFTVLALAMFRLSTMNSASAENLGDAERARAAAESGIRWMTYRFVHMSRPKTTIGNITPAVANTLWPAIASAVQTDYANNINASERTVTISGSTLTTVPISLDTNNGKFSIKIQQHPLNVSDPLDQRSLHVTSTGTYGACTRTISMDFTISKSVPFAVVGKVEIQLGKNTLVEGNIAMGTANKFPPYVALSDFKHLTPALDTAVGNFETFLKNNHSGLDGRISIQNQTEWNSALSAGYTDVNGDGYIDEYDLFLKQFDTSKDKQITQAEFTNSSTGLSYDANLFSAIDSLGGPLTPTDPIRAGYQNKIIANNDGYAKVRGTVMLEDTEPSWAANLASQGLTINDMFAGPIIPPTPATPPVQFGVPPTDLIDLSPSNFDTSGFAAQSGTNAGASSQTPTTLTNMNITPALANGGTATEQTPYQSTSNEATYKRPVFNNMNFVNCTIPLGLNALFENCTFSGVTYVHTTTNITNPSGQTSTSASDGMTWSQRMVPGKGSFSASTALTAVNSLGFQQGNNLRFDNCSITGPIAADVPTAYAHFTNSWEFTGSTVFNNTVDQTATIVAPQTNIEMGSFVAPTQAPSTLLGVVVVGNIDIRGTTLVDGSIIVTGDGAANTTLGWFGNSDASSDPNSIPAQGWGKINLRYNPNRALPNGINIAVNITPTTSSYVEGQ